MSAGEFTFDFQSEGGQKQEDLCSSFSLLSLLPPGPAIIEASLLAN